MTPLAALFLCMAVPSGQETSKPDQSSVDQLVNDLGAADPQRRDQAEKELEKAGPDAVPALRKAARSENAEQAMRARQLLLNLSGKDRPAPAPRMSVVYDDWIRGIHYAVKPNGSVELTVPEKSEGSGQREFRTYRATSIDEFKKKYPEVAKNYEIDKLITIRQVAPGEEEGTKESGPGKPSEEGEEPGGKRFGVLVSPVDPALGSHLGLREGDGLVVRQIEPGSLAEQSGLKPFDVIVALNGEKPSSRNFEEFRTKLQEALGTNEFRLDLIRQGRRETIHVKPPAEEKKSPAK